MGSESNSSTVTLLRQHGGQPADFGSIAGFDSDVHVGKTSIHLLDDILYCHTFRACPSPQCALEWSSDLLGDRPNVS